MKRKIPFQELAAMLAKAAGVSDNDSRKFIKDFFETVEEALLAGESVKIKNFGQFEIDRKDGEAEVIFTPDPMIADTVNAPFCQFEPEILNSGVTDEMLNSVSTAETEPEQVSEPEPEPETKEKEAAEEPTPAEPADEPVVLDDIDDDDDDEPVVFIPVEQPAAEQIEAVAEIIADDNTDNTSSAEAESVIIPIEEDEEEIAQPTEKPATEEDTVETADSSDNKGGFGLGFLIGALVGLAVGAAATFFYTGMIADSYNTGRSDAEIELQEVEEAFPLVADTIQPADTVAAPKVNETVEPVEEPVEIAKPAPEPKPVKETVKPGFLMQNMALKHYGNKVFWVYIYQENKSKISNPDNIPAGLTLIIPPAEKYSIDSKNKASINAAKDLESKILSRR